MPKNIEAYLDIETTGLSPGDCMLTVAGIYLCCDDSSRVIQLVGQEITADSLLCALKGVSIVHTYNGSRFDLPFINCRLGLDISRLCAHRDLMFDCWRNNLYGGLKSVERQLGIERRLKDVNGLEAVRLWWRYVDNFDTDALEKLLEYNKEDIINLKMLKQKLAVMSR